MSTPLTGGTILHDEDWLLAAADAFRDVADTEPIILLDEGDLDLESAWQDA